MSETTPQDPQSEPRSIDVIVTGTGSWPGLKAFMEYTEELDRQLGTDTTVTLYASAADYAAGRPAAVSPDEPSWIGIIGLYMSNEVGQRVFDMAVATDPAMPRESAEDRIRVLAGALRVLSRSARAYLENAPERPHRDPALRRRMFWFRS